MRTILLLFLATALVAGEVGPQVAGWRGDGTATFPGATPPTTWDVEKNVNVAWKVGLPGSSAAAPTVLGDAVYVLADPDLLLCFDLATGTQRWQVFVGLASKDDPAADATAREELAKALAVGYQERKPFYEAAAKVLGRPKFSKPELGFTVAAPLCDGERVYACTGIGMVAAFTTAGKKAWRVENPGGLSGSWNASPRLVEGHLIVTAGGSGMCALDPASGTVRWTAKGNEPKSGRVGTPALWSKGGAAYLVASNTTVVRAKDGKVMSTGGVASGTEASPVVAGDRIFFTRGDDHAHGEQFVEAFDLKLDGETVTLTAAWRTPDRRKANKGGFSRVTPLVVGDRLLSIVPGKSALWVESLADGKPWEHGVAVEVRSASHTWRPEPILAGGHLYVPTNDGIIHVVKTDGEKWSLVHAGNFGAPMTAAPTAAGKHLLVRTAKDLFCLGAK